MSVLALVLYVLALVFLVLAALGVPSPGRGSWGWAGLALWLLASLLPAFGALAR